MKIAVYNCSPKGQSSLTYVSMKCLEKMFPEDTFLHFFSGNGNLTDEMTEAAKSADILILTSSLFHCGCHAQMLDFMPQLVTALGRNTNKAVTYFMTSNCIGEDNAFDVARAYFGRNGFNYIEGMNIHSEGIREERVREAMFRWFTNVKQLSINEELALSKPRQAVIFNVLDKNTNNILDNIENIKKTYESKGFSVKVVDAKNYNVVPCIGCSGCYTDCECQMKDDFKRLSDDVYIGTELVVIVAKVEYCNLGKLYKTFLDKHVQYGRMPLHRETIWNLVYIEGEQFNYSDIISVERHLHDLLSFGRDTYIGSVDMLDTVAGSEAFNKLINKTVSNLNNEMYPQFTTSRDAMDLKFGRLAYELQKMCKRDYEYYSHTQWTKLAKVNELVKDYHSMEDGLRGSKMRTIPLYQIINNMEEGAPKLTERRPYSGLSFAEGLNQHVADLVNGVTAEDTPIPVVSLSDCGAPAGPPPGVDVSKFNGPPPWVLEGRAPTPEEIAKYGLTGPPPGAPVRPAGPPPGSPMGKFSGPPPWVLEGRAPTPEEIKKYGLTGPPPGFGG